MQSTLALIWWISFCWIKSLPYSFRYPLLNKLKLVDEKYRDTILGQCMYPKIAPWSLSSYLLLGDFVYEITQGKKIKQEINAIPELVTNTHTHNSVVS